MAATRSTKTFVGLHFSDGRRNGHGSENGVSDLRWLCRALRYETLRHYKDIGLLIPARQGGNGYSYYDVEQFYGFYAIAIFRQTGTPLEEISQCVRERDASWAPSTGRGKRRSLHHHPPIHPPPGTGRPSLRLGEARRNLSVLLLPGPLGSLRGLSGAGPGHPDTAAFNRRKHLCLRPGRLLLNGEEENAVSMLSVRLADSNEPPKSSDDFGG